MDISIIIVSYNVRAFLEKCLESVFRAAQGLEAEVLVVDNNSVDDSVSFISEVFPQVHVIANKENVGFGRANNQAIKIARGKYTLILNPDTILNEETLHTCLRFHSENHNAGIVGVKMLDGTGRYLPESKRGLPSPKNAFFKTTGISQLFPSSGFFNGYYMGGLSSEEVNEVPILTGAFMFCKTEQLQRLGGFDEEFFMYGEDIDLSYRFLKDGSTNYYLPETTIIHYKGESTSRSSLEYVRTFYSAMFIFVDKHYSGLRGLVLKQFLRLGIIAKGAASGLARLLNRVFIPVVHLLLTAATIFGVKAIWSRAYYEDVNHFEQEFNFINLPLYTLIWFVGLFIAGAYGESQRKVGRYSLGILIGTLLLLIVYALLPEELRSSRAVILLSAPLIIVVLSVFELLRTWLGGLGAQRRLLVVGGSESSRRIMEMMNRIDPDSVIVGAMSVNNSVEDELFLNEISRLPEVIDEYSVDVIFSATDIEFHEISSWMSRLGPVVSYRIAGDKSSDIIGSDSKKTTGKLYTRKIEFSIDRPSGRRSKRLVDIIYSVFVLLLSPLRMLTGGGRNAIRNATSVLKGSHTWISYDQRDSRLGELPRLRPGFINPLGSRASVMAGEEEAHTINFLYAREYSAWRDIGILLRS